MPPRTSASRTPAAPVGSSPRHGPGVRSRRLVRRRRGPNPWSLHAGELASSPPISRRLDAAPRPAGTSFGRRPSPRPPVPRPAARPAGPCATRSGLEPGEARCLGGRRSMAASRNARSLRALLGSGSPHRPSHMFELWGGSGLSGGPGERAQGMGGGLPARPRKEGAEHGDARPRRGQIRGEATLKSRNGLHTHTHNLVVFLRRRVDAVEQGWTSQRGPPGSPHSCSEPRPARGNADANTPDVCAHIP